jgi:DNA primase
VLLALDADSAGQEAMLKSAGLAAKRKLELRVVALPEGADPAELVQRDGPEAVAAAVEASVPFIRFRVERVLAGDDGSTSEGQDRMIEQLRPVFAQLPPSVMRAELMKLVARRFGEHEDLLERRLAAEDPGTRSAPKERNTSREVGVDSARARARPPSGRDDAERAFLALCIASPDDGESAIAGVEIDEHFSSELLRRAARWLGSGHLRQPLASSGESGGLQDDPELQRLLAELVVEAGRDSAHPAMLEVQRLQLELARVDRQVQRARGQESGDVSDLAHRRAEVKREFDRAYERVLQETGDRTN